MFQRVTNRSVVVILGEDSPLTPYTTYTIYVETCTAGGCASSPSIEVQTESDTPHGMLAPRATNITATAMDVIWSAPSSPNGEILE